MAMPEELEQRHTLTTATSRFDALRMRDALAAMDSEQETALSPDEMLEMLALSEVIMRKAGYGRQAMIRSARAAGASWTRIGAALGTSKQAAWESHQRWVEDQVGLPD
jgi:ribosomal protein S11